MDEEIRTMCKRLGLDPAIFDDFNDELAELERELQDREAPRTAPRNTRFPLERVCYRTESGGWADRPATEDDYARRRGVKEVLGNGR